MTGPTHRQYSVTFVCIAAMILYSKRIFTTSFAVNQPNYYLAVLMMLPIAKIGARFPDVDHDWEYVKDKTVVNKVINMLIHATGGKHRSWQTHSIDITAWLTIAAFTLPDTLIYNMVMSSVNGKLVYLIAVAFMSGWVSHIFSDMLNGVGVRIFFWNGRRAAFVPKKFLGIHFNTGEQWEAFNFSVIRKINILLGLLTISYPYVEPEVKQALQHVVNAILNLWR
jgi:hypothetical protein